MSRVLTPFAAWAAFLLIATLYGFSFHALLAQHTPNSAIPWTEIGQILYYSSLQALLSAGGALLFGILGARALFYLDFVGKNLFYKLVAFSWALPSLVIIFSVIGVWGHTGWLARFIQQLGWEWTFSLYGLQGILIAHLLLNIPLVIKYVLEGLSLIPPAQYRLAAQLNLSGRAAWRIVEWPALKAVLPYAFMSVFLVCFTSFPIVLMLGGGPKFSTLEVAIYQAVSFEFDFAKAVQLIMVQLLLGITLQLLMDSFSQRVLRRENGEAQALDTLWKTRPRGTKRLQLQLFLILLALFVLLPQANVVWHGLRATNLSELLAQPDLWQAAAYSLMLGGISAFSVVATAYVIALHARRLAYQRQKIAQSLLSSASTLPLILPIFLPAIGLFLLLMEVELSHFDLLLLVGLCNGLSLLPFVYRLIFNAMWKTLVNYEKLATSLGLSGLRRWWIVEWVYLKRPLRNAFALAMAASLGNFSVIAFFGSPDFLTLPYLLYQQLGSYRTEEAAVTAFVLMLFALLPFLFIEQRELK